MLCIIPMIQISGCSPGGFMRQQDVERILPVQTLGFDRDGSGIHVTLSTGRILNNTQPIILTGLASGIEPALVRLQDYSPKDLLYYDHVQYILCGESMARDSIEPVLDWVERSPFMRMDTQVFLVKSSAEEAILSASGEMSDITERLSSLERESSARGQHIYTLLEISSNLASQGSSLCTAVESVSSDGTVFNAQSSSPGNALLPVGYGVLQDGRLVAYLTQAESLGVILLEQDPTGSKVEIERTTLELLRGKTDVSGQWSEDGSLAGIMVTAELDAGIVEQDPSVQITTEQLNDALSAAAQSWPEDVLHCSQGLSCDFLNMKDKILRHRFGKQTFNDNSWSEIFPSLPITVEVNATIQRGYDRSG